MVERWKSGLLFLGVALLFAGCGAEEQAPPPEEVAEGDPSEEGSDEVCLYGMDCYNPSDDGPSGEEIFAAVEDGFPAPGSECPVPEPWGFELTNRMDNTQLVDCDGNPIHMHDQFCGATVGWLYFFRGAG